MKTISQRFFKHLITSQSSEIKRRFAELEELFRNLSHTSRDHLPTVRRHKNGTVAGAVSFTDALYLYMLVRELQPKVIFEIGTWVGMSAQFMAEAIKKNGEGIIYTCDNNSYYAVSPSYDRYIKRIHAMSYDAISKIPPTDVIDFVFTDGALDAKTIEELGPKINQETVFVTHDFKFPGDKGIQNAVQLQKNFHYIYTYAFPPSHFDLGQEEYSLKKSSIAVLLPDGFSIKYGVFETMWKRRIFTSLYRSTMPLGKVWRRAKYTWAKLKTK